MEGNDPVSNALPIELPRGRYSSRLDDKGRLKLPATFAQFFNSLTERKLFLTSLDRSIAQLYPIAEWRANEKIFSEFREKPGAAKNVLFNAQDLGAEVELDNQGRITVNTDLRRELGMEGQELHLMAVKGHLEILTEARYQERKRSAQANPADDVETMEMAGLR